MKMDKFLLKSILWHFLNQIDIHKYYVLSICFSISLSTVKRRKKCFSEFHSFFKMWNNFFFTLFQPWRLWFYFRNTDAQTCSRWPETSWGFHGSQGLVGADGILQILGESLSCHPVPLPVTLHQVTGRDHVLTIGISLWACLSGHMSWTQTIFLN